MNVVYCLDENYNIQFYVSVNSLLSMVSAPLNIYLLHSNPKSLESKLKKIRRNINCNKLTVFKVDTDEINFPNIDKAHITSATYFRLFIPKYLKDLDYIVYIDADTITISDPTQVISNEINLLSKSNFYISAVTETNISKQPEYFKRLKLNGRNYFNAGFFILNLKKFKLDYQEDSLLIEMEKLSESIKFWDQDVLNKFFDQKWLSITEALNYRVDIAHKNQLNLDHVYIVHYVGSKKPWTFEGAVSNVSYLYQKNYIRFVNPIGLHLTTSWKSKLLKDLLRFIFSFEIFKFRYPLKLILSSFYLLIKIKK